MKLKPCNCLKTIEIQTKKVLREQTFKNSWKHYLHNTHDLASEHEKTFIIKIIYVSKSLSGSLHGNFLIGGAKIFSYKLESKYRLPPTKLPIYFSNHFLGFAKYVEILNLTGVVVLKRS